MWNNDDESIKLQQTKCCKSYITITISKSSIYLSRYRSISQKCLWIEVYRCVCVRLGQTIENVCIRISLKEMIEKANKRNERVALFILLCIHSAGHLLITSSRRHHSFFILLCSNTFCYVFFINTAWWVGVLFFLKSFYFFYFYDTGSFLYL